MRYEPHRLRPAFEALRRPFDKRFNDALDQIILVLEPFEDLEVWVAKIAERVEKLEDAQKEEEEKETEQGKGQKDFEARESKGQEAN